MIDIGLKWICIKKISMFEQKPLQRAHDRYLEQKKIKVGKYQKLFSICPLPQKKQITKPKYFNLK